MEVQIKRTKEEPKYLMDHPLPSYQTNGSVGFDFWGVQDVHIEPGEIALIPTNLTIKVPDGYTLMVTLRSSTPRKWGVIMPQGVGIVDQDYCGPDDEIMIQVLNFRSEAIIIPEGTRIAQGVLVKVGIINHWVQLSEDDTESRGGFGSTG